MLLFLSSQDCLNVAMFVWCLVGRQANRFVRTYQYDKAVLPNYDSCKLQGVNKILSDLISSDQLVHKALYIKFIFLGNHFQTLEMKYDLSFKLHILMVAVSVCCHKNNPRGSCQCRLSYK